MTDKKEMLAPSIVLVCICLVASMLLAATYQITKPIIDDIAIRTANEARAEVLPEADGFTQMDIDLLDGVTEVYEANNGAGYVVTATFKGFGGPVTVMTGMDADGVIQNVKVTDASNETPGLGSKTTLPDHTGKFQGKSGSINMDDKSSSSYVAPVTGASYSSKAVFNAVSAALQQFAAMGGAN
ncbi:MAG: FMN-binding protein [Clostridia bacterium]|nr:FMN-binding protein [Clostridia bacterium]